jgi:hypothetical protein
MAVHMMNADITEMLCCNSCYFVDVRCTCTLTSKLVETRDQKRADSAVP